MNDPNGNYDIAKEALKFTLELGTVPEFDEEKPDEQIGEKKVIKWNGLFNGAGGTFPKNATDAAPASDCDNFWEYQIEDDEEYCDRVEDNDN